MLKEAPPAETATPLANGVAPGLHATANHGTTGIAAFRFLFRYPCAGVSSGLFHPVGTTSVSLPGILPGILSPVPTEKPARQFAEQPVLSEMLSEKNFRVGHCAPASIFALFVINMHFSSLLRIPRHKAYFRPQKGLPAGHWPSRNGCRWQTKVRRLQINTRERGKRCLADNRQITCVGLKMSSAPVLSGSHTRASLHPGRYGFGFN